MKKIVTTIIILITILLVTIFPFSVRCANKVIGVSGWENNEKNSIIKRWEPVLEKRGVFEEYGYKHVESLALPGTGRENMEQDIYAVATKIENELNDPEYEDIDAIDLVGHSKGGVAINNFANIIANPHTKEYKTLKKIAPHLMKRWKKNPYFIENVVTVSAPMNGTFRNLIKLAHSDTLLATAFRNTARLKKDKMKFVNEGALDLAKVAVGGGLSRLDYYNSLRPGVAHKTHLVAQLDYIVPFDSAIKPGLGHNEVIKNSAGHGSGFNPDNPYAVKAIFSALTHDPKDKSDYNYFPVSFVAIAKDFLFEKGIELISTKIIKKWDDKLKKKLLNAKIKKIVKIFSDENLDAFDMKVKGKVDKVFSVVKNIVHKIYSLISGNKKQNSGSTSSGGIEWTSLDEVEKYIFDEGNNKK